MLCLHMAAGAEALRSKLELVNPLLASTLSRSEERELKKVLSGTWRKLPLEEEGEKELFLNKWGVRG